MASSAIRRRRSDANEACLCRYVYVGMRAATRRFNWFRRRKGRFLFFFSFKMRKLVSSTVIKGKNPLFSYKYMSIKNVYNYSDTKIIKTFLSFVVEECISQNNFVKNLLYLTYVSYIAITFCNGMNTFVIYTFNLFVIN